MANQTTEILRTRSWMSLSQDELHTLWKQLPSNQEVKICDEQGYNVAQASMRPVGDGRWLYQDDVNGFEVLNAPYANTLIEKYTC